MTQNSIWILDTVGQAQEGIAMACNCTHAFYGDTLFALITSGQAG